MKIKNFISKQIIDIKTYGLRELFRKFNLLIKVFRGFFSYEILAIIKPKKTIEELIQSAEEK